ncbi:hypothetical protein, partial [Xanthovirga aplysinae]
GVAFGALKWGVSLYFQWETTSIELLYEIGTSDKMMNDVYINSMKEARDYYKMAISYQRAGNYKASERWME